MGQLSALHTAIADAINDFKFGVAAKDTSPPNLTPEQLTIRNLTIIDLAKNIAGSILFDDGEDEQRFLQPALSRRT
jgi:hypothetical protein